MRPSSAQRCSVGNTLPGLSRPLSSKAHLSRCCCVEIGLREHHRHQVALLDADAVLAGEHAADLDAELEDLGAELLGLVELARLVGVVEDQRMQVAVAGMEHVGDAQAVVLRQLADALEHLRQLGARDGAVHAVVVGRDAPDRRERGLAAGPEQQPLLLRRRHLAGDGAAVARDRLDARDQMVDLGLRAVELDDQQRLDVERIAGMHEFLGGMDRGLVHHLHAAGDDAGADDARRRNRRRPPTRVKPTSTARAVSGFFRMRTVTSVTTPSSPSEPVMMPSRS